MVNGELASSPLPLLSLNHVSLVCKSVPVSVNFYERVLGFVNVRRPSSFDFEGAWLFNYGVGIHLLQCKSADDLPKKSEINPRDNHTSFQSTDVRIVEKKLQAMNIKYVKRIVEDGGVYVDQLFFHDPDGYMIEICNCENLPVIPLSTSSCQLRLNNPALQSNFSKANGEAQQGNYSEIATAPQLLNTVDAATPLSVENGGFPKLLNTLNATPATVQKTLVPKLVNAGDDTSPTAQKGFSFYKKTLGSAGGADYRCSAEVPHSGNKSLYLDVMDFIL